jgi:hypothetical protein
MRLLLVLAFALASVGPIFAQAEDDGPPIAITSPDKATTFAFGTIKSHTLIWNKAVLIARITFTDEDAAMTPSTEDMHEFRLPGITFDAAKGIFYAQSAKGEMIPVAHIKKTLFINSIETLPNARVRVIHPKGNVTVVLEAVSPDDPALHAPPGKSDPSGTQQVDIQSTFR